MKIEKISDTQIRCTLTKEDLDSHQIRISELAYGTSKASAKGVKIGCFADTVEGGKKWRDLGVKFIGYGCDTYIFMQAAKADVAAFGSKMFLLHLLQIEYLIQSRIFYY